MMQPLLLTLIMSGLLLPSWVLARPVSYPDGWTLMLKHQSLNHQNKYSSAHIHYSPTARYSVGYRAEHRQDQDRTLHAVQLNVLLKRWNQMDSQANVYLKTGAGVLSQKASTQNERLGSGFVGLAADWENRRYFVLYSGRYNFSEHSDSQYQQTARVGLAPSVGKYNDLHTWVMLQADKNQDNDISLTPLVRLFKGVHLVELGGTHNAALFNYIVRY